MKFVDFILASGLCAPNGHCQQGSELRRFLPEYPRMVSLALPARVGRKEDMFGNGGDERPTRRCIGCDEKKKSWASRLTGHHPFVSMLHYLSRTARGELLRGLRLADCNLTFSLTAQDVLLGCQIHFSLSCSPPPFFFFFVLLCPRLF